MMPFERFEERGLETLTSDAHPVGPARHQRRCDLLGDGLGIRLDGEFLERACGNRIDRLKHPPQPIGREHGRGTATDEGRSDPGRVDRGPDRVHLGFEAVDERPGSIPVIDDRIEVAVMALVPTERHVGVDGVGAGPVQHPGRGLDAGRVVVLRKFESGIRHRLILDGAVASQHLGAAWIGLRPRRRRPRRTFRGSAGPPDSASRESGCWSSRTGSGRACPERAREPRGSADNQGSDT